MISASLVLYNTKESDIKTLTSCVEESMISKLIVIDQSEDGIDRRHLFSESKKTEYITKANEGYGSGHNAAIEKLTKSKYHIILNPDIQFAPEAIKSLSDELDKQENEKVGLAMPKVKYPDGSLQYLCKLLPRPVDIFLRQFAPRSQVKKLNARYALTSADYDSPMNLYNLSGCFMFFRTDVLKRIGGFDERFFMHFEDVDISRRTAEISKVVYLPVAEVIHAHAASHKTSKKMLLISLSSGIKYFNKWGWIWDRFRSVKNKEVIEKYLQ